MKLSFTFEILDAAIDRLGYTAIRKRLAEAIADLEQDFEYDEPQELFMSEAERDADVFRAAGDGTDGDYGFFGGEEYY